MSKKRKKASKEAPTIASQEKRFDGWGNIITGLGIAGRDKAVSGVFRSCAGMNFNFIEMDDLYRADGVTKRIIDIVAADMIRQGWVVEGDTDEKVNTYLHDINAYCMLTDLIKWARLYGGAIIVMGINDGRPLNEPVDELNIVDVQWLRVYDRWQAQPMFEFMCNDLNSENYGFPDIYSVNDYRTGTTFQVNHTRVLRMDWNELPPRDKMQNQGWGESVICSIYPELRNFGTCYANMATIIQDFVNGVLKMPGLSNQLASSCADSELRIIRRLDYANISKSNTGMLVLDGAESFEKISSNVAGLADLVDRFMLALCAVTGMPATLLFGRSPAGFNSTGESDIRNYYDMIKQYQEHKLKPCLEKLIRYVVISQEGPFAGVEPDNWKVEFTPLWQNTEEQEANIRRTVAETDAIYIDRGVVDPDEIAESRFGGGVYSSNTIIDMEMRKNKYNAGEIDYLEAQKAKEPDVQVSVGPDALSQEAPEFIVV